MDKKEIVSLAIDLQGISALLQSVALSIDVGEAPLSPEKASIAILTATSLIDEISFKLECEIP